MIEDSSSLQPKLKTAGFLLIVGLLVEVITLYWSNPTSFLFFIGVSGTLVVLGMAIYLLALITA